MPHGPGVRGSMLKQIPPLAIAAEANPTTGQAATNTFRVCCCQRRIRLVASQGTKKNRLAQSSKKKRHAREPSGRGEEGGGRREGLAA